MMFLHTYTQASENDLLNAHDKLETFVQKHTLVEKELSQLVDEKKKWAEQLAAAKATGE